MRVLGLMLVALLCTACGWGVVDPGERAVFARWGKIDPVCYPEGLYWYNPATTDMYEIDAKVQAFEVKKATAASRDLQEIHADIVLNFAVDGTKCHELLRIVGADFKSRIIVPAVQEVLKAATAHFPIEKVIQERARLKDEILKGLRDRLTPYHIVVNDVALTNFEFSAEFSKAIERKQVEEQNVQRAEFLRQQAVKEAERQVELAQGQAKSNKLIRESLAGDLLQFEALKRWNGVLPTVTGGAVPFINVEKSK
jgi:regulator of protease activity HflC (stomatin/prohibitin superfamily)